MLLSPELEPIASLEDARADWDELAQHTGNPFSTWEWAQAWWNELGVSGELMLRRLRDADGRVAALLPLYRARRGPLEVVRFVGHGPADELGPVCAPADLPLAAAALRQVAAEGRGRILLAERLPGDGELAPLLGGTRVRDESTPLIDVAGRSWDEWLASRSRNFREQVRRRERKVVREHEAAFRRTEDPHRLDADLDLLFDLHARRWSDGKSVAFVGRREALHRAFARRALERGWLRLWFLVAGGTEVAAMYCLRYAGHDWYYQAGRDPGWDTYRVGSVLLARTIRDAFDDGMETYRFGLGDEPYKDRFAERDPGLSTVLIGGRVAAPATSRLIGATRRLPGVVRRRLARHVD